MGYQNFYSSKITNDIGAGDTTIIVDNAPTSTSGRMVLEARNTTQREIIKYTGVSGNTLTGVTRGQGGTTAKSHVAGALIQQNATAEDLQDLYDAFGSFAATNNDWRTLVATLNTVTYNGNRSYTCTFNSNDLTSTLSPGMRLRTTRTVAAPTQCTSLNGTTQYYSKSSPAAMTFTDDFVVSAWVKLTSYPSGDVGIMNRGTSTGFWYGVNSAGRVILNGFKSGGGNFRRVTSYQSLPLNKWVHVSAQLDMSAYTATTTTCYVMLDGVDVPAIVEQGGSNPADISGQTGDLNIGAIGGANFFPGKIAQVAIYNAKVTQATIKASISQGLSGSETSLISAYSFNNTINDLSANANNLTANGAAVATNADSPFGGQASGLISATLDYGIIQSVTFSTNTTVVVQVPEGCTIPTSGGVSAVSYSTQKAPYGFPAQRGKWVIESITKALGTQSSPTVNVWYNINSEQLNVPIGSWRLYYLGDAQANSASSSVTYQMTLSTANNSESNSKLTGTLNMATHTNSETGFYREDYIDTSSATPYYLNTRQTAGTSVTLYNTGTGSALCIEAENAYL